MAGTTYTDSFSVASADGTKTSVVINILGTNDAAVLSSATKNLTETNAALTSSGTLTISDVDSAATYVAQTDTAGTYGKFSIGTNGAWTYTASSAHNEFVGGTTYTDTFDVVSADGTHTSVVINILGTNDPVALSVSPSTLVTVLNEDAESALNAGSLTFSATDETDQSFALDSSLLFASIRSLPDHGTLFNRGVAVTSLPAGGLEIAYQNLGDITFTPASNEYGVRYTAVDLVGVYRGSGQPAIESAVNKAYFSVRAVNDAPTSTDVSPVSLYQGQRFAIDLKSVFSDVDVEDLGKLKYSTVGVPEGLTVEIAGSILTVTSSTSVSSSVSVGLIATDPGQLAALTALNVTLRGIATGSNQVPSLTGPASTVDVAENTSFVFQLVGSDLDGDPMSYSLSGPDASKFQIDPDGSLGFASAPNYEAPADVGGTIGDNVYQVTATVSDGRGGVAVRDVAVRVTDVVEGAQPAAELKIAVTAGGGNKVIDLNQLFENPQGAGQITYELLTTDPPFPVVLKGSELTLYVPSNYSGFFDISVRTTANGISSTYSTRIAVDRDTDGVDDFTELFAGDLNQDGISDELQSATASFPLVTSDVGDPATYVSLAANSADSALIRQNLESAQSALMTEMSADAGLAALRDKLPSLTSKLKIEGVGVGQVSSSLLAQLTSDVGSALGQAQKTLTAFDAPMGMITFNLAPEIVASESELSSLSAAERAAFNSFKQSYEQEIHDQFATTQQVVKVVLPKGAHVNAYVKPVYAADGKTIVRYENFTLQTVGGFKTGAEFVDSDGDGDPEYALLYFVDNQRGDDDPALGNIHDPGVFAWVESTATTPAKAAEFLPPTAALDRSVTATVSMQSGSGGLTVTSDSFLVEDRTPQSSSYQTNYLSVRSTENRIDTVLGRDGGLLLESSDHGFEVERVREGPSEKLSFDSQQKGSDRLFVFRGVEGTLVEVGQGLHYRVPRDAFGHTNPDAIVYLEATQLDGSPLPEWLDFDPTSGTFSGRPPAAAKGVMDIRVTARDDQGRQASTHFRIHIESKAAVAELSLPIDFSSNTNSELLDSVNPGSARSLSVPRGVIPFSDQLRLARRDPVLDQILARAGNGVRDHNGSTATSGTSANKSKQDPG